MDKKYFKEYFHQERNHWWFQARLDILNEVIGNHLREPVAAETPKILNAGIATGATSIMLEKHGEVTSLEYDSDCCEFVREELGIEVINASLTELPFADEYFDVICAFDVIEHIQDDRKAIAEIYRCLRPGGKVFLTVPAFESLWSEHDVINHHFKRYRLPEFVSLQQEAGFTSSYRSYFNSFLFPPIAAVRGLNRLLFGRAGSEKYKRKEKPISDFERFNTEGITNRILRRVFLTEKKWLGSGRRFLFGVSILTVSVK